MEGDGAEEVEVLKHRKEGHVMNEDRGVRRESAANIGRDIERVKGEGLRVKGRRGEKGGPSLVSILQPLCLLTTCFSPCLTLTLY